MKKRSAWEKFKAGLGFKDKAKGTGQEWVRRQFAELSRLGGNPIVMQMGN